MQPIESAALLLLATLWGGSFLFMRVAAPVLGPVWLIELRVLLAGVVLLPLLLHFRLWGEVRRNWFPLCVVGFLNSALPFVLFAYAALVLPSGLLAILNATTPLFGLIVAWVWLREPLTSGRLLGFGLGFSGVVLLVGTRAGLSAPDSITAVLAGLLAPLSYAIAAPYAKRELSQVSPLVVATLSQLSAAVYLLPFVPFAMPQRELTGAVVISVVALALVSTSAAYILYFWLIKTIGSTRTLTVTYLIPVFAMGWGALLLQEAITVVMVAGCLLILLGTAIANNLISGGKQLNN
jgi:drug/metabolite transporter (DMT)-like permease